MQQQRIGATHVTSTATGVLPEAEAPTPDKIPVPEGFVRLESPIEVELTGDARARLGRLKTIIAFNPAERKLLIHNGWAPFPLSANFVGAHKALDAEKNTILDAYKASREKGDKKDS